MTGVTGKDILVFAPEYQDARVPARVWETNRFPVVILKLKQEAEFSLKLGQSAE